MQALRVQAGAAVAAVLLAASGAAWGQEAPGRSRSVRADFQRTNPCPATGLPRGACPGWVVDHVFPLCAGGPDGPGNLQWQRAEEARVKDGEERRLCRRLRGG